MPIPKYDDIQVPAMKLLQEEKSLSHLNLAGLLDKPKRGTYEINQKGIEILNTPSEIKQYIRKEVREKKTD